MLRDAGCELVFMPRAEEIYRDGYRYRVSESESSLQLEGAARPGHFDGVLTVVLKLLLITRPDRAYFGEKDFQQLQLVEGLVHAFFLDTRIVRCPTVREPDGLAMSSRNRLLSPAERARAPALHRVLAASVAAAPAARRGRGVPRARRIRSGLRRRPRRPQARGRPPRPSEAHRQCRITKHRGLLFQLTGSIACFKACELVSRLAKRGIAVQTVASAGALRFVGAATLEGLTGRTPFTDLYEAGRTMDHIRLARWADVALLCPATANSMNRLAAGLADDAIGALFLAWEPAKKPYLDRAGDERDDVGTPGDTRRARAARGLRRPHPAGRRRTPRLRRAGRGPPARGGRARETRSAGAGGEAMKAKVVVTSGATREPIDSVRLHLQPQQRPHRAP